MYTVTNEYVNYFPIGKNGKWGYANEDGDLTIEYNFEKVTFFKGDRAAAKLDGKFGFINKEGEFFKKPKFDSIGYFTNERANVIKRGKQFAIDRSGKKLKEGITISTEGNPFENAKPLDYFELKGGKFVLNNKEFENAKRLDPTANFEISDFTFEEVIPFSRNSFIVKKGNKYDIYLLNYGGLKNLWVDNIEPIQYEWNNGISSNYAKYQKDGKWGLLSNTGKILIEPDYFTIKNATGQYYLVEYKPNHWGYVSQTKKMFKDYGE
ncbi:MAG: WG repeat-containing protein [Lewinellaceae bacterium]|nr:WG repeat-containing protein [Lewinellaceae bacterium]